MSTISSTLDQPSTLKRVLGWLWPALMLLILGAHFYRGSEYGIVLCVIGILVFANQNSAWKHYAVAFFLFWGMLEWGESAWQLARMRTQMELPWLRLAAILLSVAALTGLAGKQMLSRARRASAQNPQEYACFKGSVFMLTFLLLFYLRHAAKMDFLLLERYLPVLGSVQIFFAAWYAAFIGGKLVVPRQSRKTRRRIWLIFGGVFFAQFFFGLFGLERMLLSDALHVPVPALIILGPLFRNAFSMMLIIVPIATLLAGNIWCSSLCYFGALDALAAGKKGVRPYPEKLRFVLQYGQLIVLLIGVLLALGLRAAGTSGLLAASVAVVFAVLSLLFMVLVSRPYRGMAYCTMVCPMGLVTRLLGRLSPWRVRVDTQRCDDCGICEKICKYQAITPASRADGKTLSRCTLCRDCIGSCAEKAIFIHFPGLAPERAWLFLSGLTTVLHVLFLSVAMA